MKKWVSDLVERQLDDYATGTQDRRFLRDYDGQETCERQLLRLNFEQFARRLLAKLESAERK